MPALGFKPSEMVEGGIIPQDVVVTFNEARFAKFDYLRKDGTVAATTIALRVKVKSEDGTDYTMHYSVGDPKDFAPSEDGESPADEGPFVISLGERTALSKSSNFHLFLSNLVNAGFPESKIGADARVFEGMQAFMIAIPEPKRTGLARPTPAEGARERLISVPQTVIKLPWEKVAKKTTGAATATAKTAPAGKAAPSPAVIKETIDFIMSKMGDESSIERSDVASAVYSDLGKNPNREAIAAAVYHPALTNALAAAGLKLDGDTISRAG